MKLKNVFLVLSLIAFAIGFSDAGESMFWYLGRPIGAIFFGLYLIFAVLGNEAALLDEQNQNNQDIEGPKSGSRPVEKGGKQIYAAPGKEPHHEAP